MGWNTDVHLAHDVETLITYMKQYQAHKREKLRTVYDSHKYEKWLLSMYKTRKFNRAVIHKGNDASAIVMSPRAPTKIIFKSKEAIRKERKERIRKVHSKTRGALYM